MKELVILMGAGLLYWYYTVPSGNVPSVLPPVNPPGPPRPGSVPVAFYQGGGGGGGESPYYRDPLRLNPTNYRDPFDTDFFRNQGGWGPTYRQQYPTGPGVIRVGGGGGSGGSGGGGGGGGGNGRMPNANWTDDFTGGLMNTA